ncbi:MAG: hypothetical protein PHF64_00265 [Methanoregula sp.]|jgi:hypothetical protein|nr:hypothetical protein [Methanoregula sp.]
MSKATEKQTERLRERNRELVKAIRAILGDAITYQWSTTSLEDAAELIIKMERNGETSEPGR